MKGLNLKILVTGGAGYIGSHVVKALLKQGKDEITIIDNLCKGSQKALETLQKIGNFKFINANLEDDLSEIFANGKFDAIIHFAAFIEVFESMSEPLKYYLNNTANVARVLRYAKTYNVNKFIFSSTAAVYGEPDVAEVSETTPLQMKISNLRFCAILTSQARTKRGLSVKTIQTPRTLSKWPFKQHLASARAWVSLAMTTRQKTAHALETTSTLAT